MAFSKGNAKSAGKSWGNYGGNGNQCGYGGWAGKGGSPPGTGGITFPDKGKGKGKDGSKGKGQDGSKGKGKGGKKAREHASTADSRDA